MGGTIRGGKLAAEKNREKYGPDFYQKIGAKGGSKSRGGGYASRKIGPDGLTGSERARVYGSLGGQIGMRTRWGRTLTKTERQRIHKAFKAEVKKNYAHLLKVHEGANR